MANRKVTLNQIEKSFRKVKKPKYFKPSVKELVYTYLTILVCTPFLVSCLLMIPLIGQALTLIFVLQTLYYIYVRRSLMVFISGLAGFISFWIPTLAVMQLIKNKLDLTVFFLLVMAVPVAMAYMMIIGCLTWWETERRYGQPE